MGADASQDFEGSSAGTLEALADQISQRTLSNLSPTSNITLTIRKPSALPFATPSICITRSATDYIPQPQASGSGSGTLSTAPSPLSHTAISSESPVTGPIFVALGSNIGDRVGNIRRAVRLLEEEGVKCMRTGRMYESEPMYVEDQARFVNTVIQVSHPSPPSHWR